MQPTFTGGIGEIPGAVGVDVKTHISATELDIYTHTHLSEIVGPSASLPVGAWCLIRKFRHHPYSKEQWRTNPSMLPEAGQYALYHHQRA